MGLKRLFNNKPLAGVRLAVLAALFLVGAHLGASSDPKLPEPATEKPVWRVDLQSQGFVREKLGFYWFANHAATWSRLDIHALALNSGGQGAFVFTTYQGRNGGGPATVIAHFISFDSATGKIVATKQWPTGGSILPTLRATARGNFLLKDANRLALYSPALDEITSIETGVESYLPHYYWTFMDGRCAFLESKRGNVYALSMLDTETLQPVRSWTLEQPLVAASEHFLAKWQELSGLFGGSLYVRSDDTEWKQAYENRGCNNRDQSANFLTRRLILIRSCNNLTVIDVEGKVFSSHTFAPNTPVDVLFGGFLTSGRYAPSDEPGEISFSSSSNGERFAVVVDKFKSDPWWTGDPSKGPVPWRLAIYDANSAEAISSFALNEKYPGFERSISFALSPSGSELALFRDGELEIFRLPTLLSSP